MKNIETLLPKLNFLVVDDMEAMRSLVRSCLYELGAEMPMLNKTVSELGRF